MIKNIVFDMGNVLVDYQPARLVAKLFPDPQEHALIMKEVFQSSGWKQLDRGTITFNDHYGDLSNRFPQYKQEIGWLLENWHIDQPLIPGIADLLKKLHAKSFDLYLLSNASKRFFTYARQMEIFNLFTGLTISAELNLLKPEKEIYDRFCQIHCLIPKECLFIDDQEENVNAALSVGWHALKFIDVKTLYMDLESKFNIQLSLTSLNVLRDNNPIMKSVRSFTLEAFNYN